LALRIIQGTTKHCDLIPAFFRELLRRNSKQGTSLFFAYGRTIKDTFEADEDHLLTSPYFVRIDLIIELMEAIDSYSDEGYYFGSRPGAIDDFGYWPIEQ
jgi:hypothetical protein